MKQLPLILLVVGANVVGQLALKQGMLAQGALALDMRSLPTNLLRAVTSPVVLAGLALYAGGALLWLVILSRADLSVAYPMVSLSYVVIAFLSWLLFREPLTLAKLAGTGLILVGVFIVSRS